MVSPHHADRPQPRGKRVRCDLLTLGEELLIGATPNGHLSFIGGWLARRGVTLRRHVTLADEPAAIEREFRQSWSEADVILVTGGLGPTVDDCTREAVAASLDEPLILDPEIERAIADRFALQGRPMTGNNRRQAYRFENGEILPNPLGTAPGHWIEKDGRIACLLPGPPNELEPMFTKQVLPRLAQRGLLQDGEAYVQLRTAGLGESLVETRLQPVFSRVGPSLQVAFCAHQGQVDVRLSSPDGKLPEGQLEEIAAEAARCLGEDFMGFGHESLPKVCADLLRRQEKSLAVAESATGGLLGHAFSDLCGACKFFAGGVICCSHDSMMQLLGVPETLLLQHGAASPECAVAMATGVAETLGADYALAITGFGGPSGGPVESQAGALHLALHAPHGVWSRTLNYPGPRCTVKQRAVNAALDWLRRELTRARADAIRFRSGAGVLP